jgi:acyl-CoA oxidase
MPMNPDLQRERSKATFSVARLTHMLDGGAAQTTRRRQLEAVIERDPTGVFSNEDNMYLHRTERHVRSLAKHVRLIELCRTLGIGDECGGEILKSKDFPVIAAAVADDFPTALHWVMFVPNIVSLCDEEQQAAWLPLCRDWRMIGCYAQTELGHGSNVRALETTATFLPESKGGMPGGSFVIHSPTLTSAKFWPGTLGRTANHAMVIARLIDADGIDRGMHNFLVPLRSMQDHTLLPGVVTGDIGPKIGYNIMDNGFATFDHVHIPRRNMAMRFALVDEQGKYSKKYMADAASKVAYITMMQVRAHICNEAGKNLAVACTIVIRYSAVRRQGFQDDDGSGGVATETQILDYKQQQHRIFPLLAASYCFYFTGKKILKRLQEIEHKLVSNKPVTKAEVTDIHASSSGLKSFTTTVTADGIEDCRKACGGHGFLQCSGLPELITTYLQNPTVEGDNHMLPQQVVKVLLKLVEAVQNNEELNDYEPCDSYHLVSSLQTILHAGSKETCEARCVQDMLEIPILLKAFRHRAARVLVGVAVQIQTSMSDGMTPQQAWNQALVEMARASRAYSQFLLLRNFVDGIQDEESSSIIGAAESWLLGDLARLFALYWMEREIGDYLEDGFLSAQQSRWVRTNVLHLLDVIRPNAVALVDARDFSDFRLKSALGRYDGDVYPAIMEAARRDPLNQSEPGQGYKEHLKRMIVDGVGKYSGTTSRL